MDFYLEVRRCLNIFISEKRKLKAEGMNSPASYDIFMIKCEHFLDFIPVFEIRTPI